MKPRESRREQVLGTIRPSRAALDDDQIAAAAEMNRVYVNMICLRLVSDGLITRIKGPGGKLVNVLTRSDQGQRVPVAAGDSPRPRRRRSDYGLAKRIEDLVANFAAYVADFEASVVFPGPSGYFHQRAIDQRRQHESVGSLLDDTLFLEYAYAVLPSWGMHRLGKHPVKVGEFADIVAALRETAPMLERLWPLRITMLTPEAAREVAATAWDVIAHIKVSTSQTQIVAGSKMLHHVLPDLIPPIDGRYTCSFFTGNAVMPPRQAAAFAVWYPQLAEIGARCQRPIHDAIENGGFMATGEAKIIDNAIVSYTQQH